MGYFCIFDTKVTVVVALIEYLGYVFAFDASLIPDVRLSIRY